MPSAAAAEILFGAGHELYLSFASIWELTIKVCQGKLDAPRPVGEFLARQASSNQVSLLPVRLPHIARLEHLPLYHRNPFDRLLIAQAQVEELAIVSADRQFPAYGVPVIW